MIEYVLMVISFISLYLATLWINVLYVEGGSFFARARGNYTPSVTILVPAHNEAGTLGKTLKSLLALNYPKNKLGIIVIDDGSTDNTSGAAKKFVSYRVFLIRKKNGGKASALNAGLRAAKGELVGCVDADSTVSPNSLRMIAAHFADERTGAVISGIMAENRNNLLERLQYFEYMFAIFFRRLIASLETLYVSPGVLSVYRTSVVRRLGGFDEKNISEDMEIALHLYHEGYAVKMELGSITKTIVPSDVGTLLRQRVRWARGMIYNTFYKYRDMFFNKKYGLMGTFQFPLNAVYPLLLVTASAVVAYSVIDNAYDLFMRIYIMGADFIYTYNPGSISKILMSLNLKVLLPIAATTGLGLFMFGRAHKIVGERWRYPGVFLAFLFLYPALLAYFWIVAAYQEVANKRAEW